jgi:hypothetical protein
MPKRDGLYQKFIVERVDGRSAPGEKHAGCQYFVLDLDHDQYAAAAIRAYAGACRPTLPELSADLLAIAGPTDADVARAAGYSERIAATVQEAAERAARAGGDRG